MSTKKRKSVKQWIANLPKSVKLELVEAWECALTGHTMDFTRAGARAWRRLLREFRRE